MLLHVQVYAEVNQATFVGSESDVLY